MYKRWKHNRTKPARSILKGFLKYSQPEWRDRKEQNSWMKKSYRTSLFEVAILFPDMDDEDTNCVESVSMAEMEAAVMLQVRIWWLSVRYTFGGISCFNFFALVRLESGPTSSSAFHYELSRMQAVFGERSALTRGSFNNEKNIILDDL